MSSEIFVVVNQSTLVTDKQVAVMTAAVNSQIRRHVAPTWGWHPSMVVVAQPGADPLRQPLGTCPIVVLDDPDQAGALGYHTETDGGMPYGVIFVRPTLDNGGGVLEGDLSVSSVLSHEVVEADGDLHVNMWADDFQGRLVAMELCDPVEGDSYMIHTRHGSAAVSDFATPHWFDPQADSSRQFNWLDTCNGPFELRPGGYMVVMESGRVSQVFGEEMPQWKRDLKQIPSSRGYSRER